MTRANETFEGADDDHAAWEAADFVPRRRPVQLRVVSVSDAQDDPLWAGDRPSPALRPRAHERCLAVEYGSESSPTILSSTWWVRVTDETLDPGWWRARLPDGVDFRLLEHPDGCDSPNGMRNVRVIGMYPATRVELTPVLVEAPPEVVLHTPAGPVLATLSRVRREDGRPLYYPVPVHWERIKNAVLNAKAVAGAVVGMVRGRPL